MIIMVVSNIQCTYFKRYSIFHEYYYYNMNISITYINYISYRFISIIYKKYAIMVNNYYYYIVNNIMIVNYYYMYLCIITN